MFSNKTMPTRVSEGLYELGKRVVRTKHEFSVNGIYLQYNAEKSALVLVDSAGKASAMGNDKNNCIAAFLDESITMLENVIIRYVSMREIETKDVAVARNSESSVGVIQLTLDRSKPNDARLSMVIAGYDEVEMTLWEGSLLQDSVSLIVYLVHLIACFLELHEYVCGCVKRA